MYEAFEDMLTVINHPSLTFRELTPAKLGLSGSTDRIAHDA